MPKALRKKSLKSSIPEGVGSTAIYCRKCMLLKKPVDFFKAVDPLDSNGYFSICKDCASKIYVDHYLFEKNLENAIYKVCRVINLKYDDAVISAVRAHLSTQGKTDDDPSVFGIYKSRLASTDSKNGSNIAVGDMTFAESNNNYGDDDKEEVVFEGAESVKEFWGENFSVEEYRFLEKTLAQWRQSYSCNNEAERFYLKQICLKLLELEQSDGKKDGILKSVQQLLKDSALTPAQQTASSSGKGTETWGMMNKLVEESSPSEYYKDKELFKDFDNIGSYIKKYITRPIKNFVTGSRDFNVNTDDDAEYDSEYAEDDIIDEDVIQDDQKESDIS